MSKMKWYKNISFDKISYYLPEKIENVEVLSQSFKNWDVERIISKTGIKKRYIANKSETAVDLAKKATIKFFDEHSISTEDIQGLIFVTQSPDYALPTSACILQHELGLPINILAFDINLGCSGFVNSLSVATSLIDSSMLNNCLVVCAETYNKYIKEDDRTTRTIFSDASAVCLVEKNYNSTFSIGKSLFGTDGSGANNLIVKGSGSRDLIKTENKYLFMDGSKVFMFTLNAVPRLVNQILEKADKQISQIDLFFFHQASKLVLDSIAKKLQIPDYKMVNNLSEIGNTVSCTIPIILCDAIRTKKLKPGMFIMLVGFGVGYSWGGTIIEWGRNNI